MLFRSGFGEPIAVSAIQGLGISSFLDNLLADFGSPTDIESEHKDMYKVAIAGRPNVGKSSLINAIVNEDRMIVDNKAGTTRDAVDLYFVHQNNRYMFTDTAGMRRRGKIDDSIEYYSFVRSQKSIKASDLTVVVLDAEDFLSDQDKKIIRFVLDTKKNLMVFVNKWDLIEDKDNYRKAILKQAERIFPALRYYPFIFGSAKERTQLGALFNQIPKIIEQSLVRISTSKMNQFVQEIVKRNPPPAKRGKVINIYYATEVEVKPPTFLFFVNHPKLIDPTYTRFIENRMRQTFPQYKGVSFLIAFKKHRE